MPACVRACCGSRSGYCGNRAQHSSFRPPANCRSYDRGLRYSCRQGYGPESACPMATTTASKSFRPISSSAPASRTWAISAWVSMSETAFTACSSLSTPRTELPVRSGSSATVEPKAPSPGLQTFPFRALPCIGCSKCEGARAALFKTSAGTSIRDVTELHAEFRGPGVQTLSMFGKHCTASVTFRRGCKHRTNCF